MESVSGAINQGVAMGSRIGGLMQGSPAAQKGNDYFVWLRKQFVQGAVGLDFDKNTGEFTGQALNWMTPPELAYAKSQYLKVAEEGYQRSLDTALKITNLRKNLVDESKKIIENEEITTEAKKGLFDRLEQAYVSILGEDGYRKLGVDLPKRLSIIQEGSEVVDTINTFKFNAISMLDREYKANPTLDNLAKYTSLYAEDPKYFKEYGFPNPNALENQFKSNARNKIEQDRKKQEQQTSANIEKQKQLDIANQRPSVQKPEDIDKRVKEFYDVKDKSLNKNFGLDSGRMDSWKENERLEYRFSQDVANSILGSVGNDIKNIDAVTGNKLSRSIASFAFHRRKGLDSEDKSIRVDTKSGELIKVVDGEKYIWTYGRWQKSK